MAQSSLADMAAHMSYENVNMAQLTCTLHAGALSFFIFFFTAKFLIYEKVEDKELLLFLDTWLWAPYLLEQEKSLVKFK